MNTLRKILLSLSLFSVLFLNLFVPFAYAQNTNEWHYPTYEQWYTKVYDQSNPQEIYGERYTAAQVWWVMYALRSFVFSAILPVPVEVWQCLYSSFSDCNLIADTGQPLPIAEKSQKDNNFLLTFSTTLFADRPLSGISYTKDKLRNLHLIPEAQAQTGYGYVSLDMIQDLWGSARNITYALMVLIIIVFAFMIMFRTKISPQAVISVQSALPKIVVALILITFSYAIAGFMIDLMYVVLGLLSLLLDNSGVAMSFNFVGGDLNAGAADIFAFFTNGPYNTGIVGYFIIYWILFMITLTASTILPGAFSDILSTLLSPALSLVSTPLSAIMGLIVSIMMIFISFKTLMVLIKTFISIILLVIAAPFIILFGAVTPASGGFTAWIRNLAAHLAVYPVAGLLFIVSLIFLDAAFTNTTVGRVGDVITNLPWAGDFINMITRMFNASILTIDVQSGINPGNSWAPPLTVGPNVGLVWLWLFASLGTIAMIPKVADIVKGAISGKPFAYGTAFGEAFGVAAAPFSFAAGAAIAGGKKQLAEKAGQVTTTGVTNAATYVGSKLGVRFGGNTAANIPASAKRASATPPGKGGSGSSYNP